MSIEAFTILIRLTNSSLYRLQIDLAVVVAAVVEVVVEAGAVAAAKILNVNEVDHHDEVHDLEHQIVIGDGINKLWITQIGQRNQTNLLIQYLKKNSA